MAFLMIIPGIAAAETCPDGYKNVSVCKAEKMVEKEDVFLLDVRTPAEFNAGYIEGAILIPLKNVPKEDPVELPPEKLLAQCLCEIPENKPILVYCKSGTRSDAARDLLVDSGYRHVYNLEGGILTWKAEGYPTVCPAI